MIKNLLDTLFILLIISTLTRLFLRHTIIGKIILFILKDLKGLIISCFKIISSTIGYIYKQNIKIYKWINKQRSNDKNRENKNNGKEQLKKVVGNEYNNIIDLENYKNTKEK